MAEAPSPAGASAGAGEPVVGQAASAAPRSEPRRHSPAADRNRAPILTELLRRLPARGDALEIACGTGQHAVFFARALAGWRWQPTDVDPAALASTDALAGDARLGNLAPARPLDLLDPSPTWPADGSLDLVYAANVLHIAPRACLPALMALAARGLRPDGRLVLYGPWRVRGEPTAPSNEAFDADLRARDPGWGLRWLHDAETGAAQVGLRLDERIAMPAHNQLLVFKRRDEAPDWRLRVEPDGVETGAPGTRSLLSSLLRAGVAWPSSCRAGSCRSCIGRLGAGRVDYLVEWPGLDPEELATGWVLPCVARPVSDVTLLRD